VYEVSLGMNAIRLFGRLVFGSRSFCALASAAARILPWVAAACLVVPGSLRADGLVLSRDEHGNSEERLRAGGALAQLFAGDAQGNLEQQLRESIIQLVNEPTQKAIILYDQGREDMVLQVKYEGPDQEFGWLIPVPGLPEVRPASMNCFYDLSRLTEEPLWPEEYDESATYDSTYIGRTRVKAADIKTIGAFEVAVLAPQDTNRLSEWLATHHFSLPKETQSLLDNYVSNHWCFVAAKIDPNQTGFALESGSPRTSPPPPSASNGVVSAELPPLIISFPAEKCVSPLALSTVNAKPARVCVFVLSGEPLTSRVIFEKKLKAYAREQTDWSKSRPEREKYYYAGVESSRAMEGGLGTQGAAGDPADPVPPSAIMAPMMVPDFPLPPFSDSGPNFYEEGDVMSSMEIPPEKLPACAREMPRLAGSKSWCLTKQAATLSPEEMCNLDFEAAVPMFAGKLYTPEGRVLSQWLPQFGARAVPLVLAGLASAELEDRRLAASVMTQMADPRLVAPLAGLLRDADPSIRASACQSAAWKNWDSAFAPQVARLLFDEDPKVRWAASNCLEFHPAESKTNIPVYQKMVEEGGVAMAPAMWLLAIQHVPLPKASVTPLLSSPDPGTFKKALWYLRDSKLELDDISPLLTNSSPMVRGHGVALLMGMGRRDKTAVDRLVSMLRDPDEGLRWAVRNSLRMLSGQKLGADPAAYEKWWAENKDTFTPAFRVRELLDH
jgi:HEAT repeat protein